VGGRGTIKQRAQISDIMTLITTRKNATPDQARTTMLAHVARLAPEKIALRTALGRTLAQDITATRDQPPFPASAMDGYAVRAADCPSALQLVGQSAAGAGYHSALSAGQCVRIFTGAPVPDGADAVVIQEDVTVDGDRIGMPAIVAGRNVRARGNDFVAGTTLLQSGTKLDPIGLALIAATGRDTVRVSTKPRIAILSGGDEIVSPGQIPSPHQIFDSLTSGLSTLIEIWGGDIVTFAPQRDTIDALQAGFEAAFGDADLVVTVGGASVGDHDLMKPALAAFSPTMIVDKVAVRPGKPTWFATTHRCPVLGLPGNPASALVCAHVFLAPLIAAFLGQTGDLAIKAAKLAAPLPANGPREHYVRAVTHQDETGQTFITPLEDQDSALLSVFQSASALVICAPNGVALAQGDLVTYLDLQRLI
jgi:molybdopterin molybdotransferase